MLRRISWKIYQEKNIKVGNLAYISSVKEMHYLAFSIYLESFAHRHRQIPMYLSLKNKIVSSVVYLYTVYAYQICFTENSNRTQHIHAVPMEEYGKEKEKQANANAAQLLAAYMRACV